MAENGHEGDAGGDGGYTGQDDHERRQGPGSALIAGEGLKFHKTEFIF